MEALRISSYATGQALETTQRPIPTLIGDIFHREYGQYQHPDYGVYLLSHHVSKSGSQHGILASISLDSIIVCNYWVFGAEVTFTPVFASRTDLEQILYIQSLQDEVYGHRLVELMTSALEAL